MGEAVCHKPSLHLCKPITAATTTSTEMPMRGYLPSEGAPGNILGQRAARRLLRRTPKNSPEPGLIKVEFVDNRRGKNQVCLQAQLARHHLAGQIIVNVKIANDGGLI